MTKSAVIQMGRVYLIINFAAILRLVDMLIRPEVSWWLMVRADRVACMVSRR
jgi:hypothetical protein